MRAVISGGNGFLGGELLRLLSSENHEVTALLRAPCSSLPRGVRTVIGDVTRTDTLAAAMKDADTVFHLAGLRRAPSRDPFFVVNAEGTRNVCEAMVASGARRLVLASSLAVHGPSTDKPHLESDPYAATEWYGESKVEAEKIALSYSGRLEIVILRPPRIMGPGDHENLPFFKIVKKGVVLKLGGPPRRLSLVDVEDCARAFLLAADAERAPSQAFLLPGPDSVTLEEIQTRAADALGLRVRKLPVPPLLLKGLAGTADVVSKVSGRSLALNRKLAQQLLAAGWTCSGEKARTVLGWTARHRAAESISRTAHWYRDHRWI